MGAKFAPCMRSDKRLQEELAEDKSYEYNTGCCVKSDNSGCIQTSEKECLVSLLHFKAALHEATCYIDFLRNSVVRKIEHRWEFFNRKQTLPMHCQVKCFVKSRSLHHVTQCTIFLSVIVLQKIGVASCPV